MMRRPIHLILDWDGTLTKRDTLVLVSRIGYRRHAGDSETDIPPWITFGEAWMNDFKKHSQQYTPAAAQRQTVQQERQWLQSLHPVESNSAARVQSSGLFKGVKADDIDGAANSYVRDGELQLRTGWDELMQEVLRPNENPEGNYEKPSASGSGTDGPRGEVSILSVNWSRRFIRSSLLAAATSIPENGEGSLPTYIKDRMTISANEMLKSLDSQQSDKVEKEIRTSADKLSHMPQRCQETLFSGTYREPMDGEPFVIYVGDSATDLECLLAADLGICVRDEPMGSTQKELAETLRRLDIPSRHVAEPSTRDPRHRLCWASNFEEIRRSMG